MNKTFLSIILIVFLSVNLFSAEYKITASDDLKKYIPNVEKLLGKTVDDILLSRHAAVDILSDNVGITQDVAMYLGCPEKQHDISNRAKFHLLDSQIIVKTLSNIKLIPESSVAGKKALQEGYVNYEFVKPGVINLVFSSAVYDINDKKKILYFPVIISDDGKILMSEKLPGDLLAACGMGDVYPALMVRDVVDYTMKSVLNIDPAFGRWYTEGMTYKITSLILNKYDKKVAASYDKLFVLTAESKKVKENVNLWNFAQYDIIGGYKGFDKSVDNASIQYSCELINKLVLKIGEKGISKLNAELKYSNFLSNDKLCKTVNDLFNYNMKTALLDYTPVKVKNLVLNGDITKLKKTAESAILAQKWDSAINIYEDLLFIDPYDYNSRLNQAFAQREMGALVESDKNIVIAADTMLPGKATISIIDIENNYNAQIVFAKYLYAQGAYRASLNILEPISKSHPDAKDIVSVITAAKDLLRGLEKIANY